jgi:hypothetical protein
MNDSHGPVAGRLRRPTWRDPRLLIGLLLIAISVVAVSSIVNSADRTTPYYAATETLTPGTVIDKSHLVLVSARIGGESYISLDTEPWGHVVTRVIEEGELVPARALASREDFDGRPVAVQSSLPLASGIGPGALVDVYLTVEGADGRPKTTQVGSALVVDQVTQDDSAFGASAGETVYVVVPEREVAAFLEALATEGDISIVGLPGLSN